ncbi:MAG: cytochrome c [Actinomycetota bacterium]
MAPHARSVLNSRIRVVLRARSASFGAAVIAGAFLMTACGGNPPLELSPLAAEGRQIANASGCASCHGKNGQGVTAPSWQGLYNEPVPLSDGTTVIADDEYLYSSITDPQGQIVADYTIKMPQNDLGDEDIELIITYIRELQ